MKNAVLVLSVIFSIQQAGAATANKGLAAKKLVLPTKGSKQNNGAPRCYCDVKSTPNKGCSDDNETACTSDVGCKWTCVYIDGTSSGLSGSATQ